MKKRYLIPEVSVVRMDGANMIAQSVTGVGGNAGLGYGGAGDGTPENGGPARVKSQGTYNVWDDDWQKGE